MARFLAGKISMGRWWYIEGVTDEDKNHPFALQMVYDGNLSYEGLLGVAWNSYRIPDVDIVYRQV